MQTHLSARAARKLLCRRALPAVIPALLLLGCGGGDPPAGGDPDAARPVVDAANPADAAPPGVWHTLIGSEWTMDPGQEGYQCVRLTVNEDTYITAFRALAPLGTHHTVLTVGAGGQADGSFSCNAATNHSAMIFGSGVGTDEIALPEGVAMPVRKGQQLLLNLHLYNVSDNPLSNTSAIEIKTIPADAVVHEAEVILMGKVVTLLVPPGESTQEGTCVMNGDATVFMIGPHMHKLGTHMQVVARSAAGDTVLLDEPYAFEEQSIYPVQPVSLAQGDEIKVYCSYNNTTGSSVPFGDSSDQEMCFAGVYRYPAYGGTFNIFCGN